MKLHDVTGIFLTCNQVQCNLSANTHAYVLRKRIRATPSDIYFEIAALVISIIST